MANDEQVKTNIIDPVTSEGVSVVESVDIPGVFGIVLLAPNGDDL